MKTFTLKMQIFKVYTLTQQVWGGARECPFVEPSRGPLLLSLRGSLTAEDLQKSCRGVQPRLTQRWWRSELPPGAPTGVLNPGQCSRVSGFGSPEPYFLLPGPTPLDSALTAAPGCRGGSFSLCLCMKGLSPRSSLCTVRRCSGGS